MIQLASFLEQGCSRSFYVIGIKNRRESLRNAPEIVLAINQVEAA